MTDTTPSTAIIEIRAQCRGFETGCACWVCILRLQHSLIKQPSSAQWSFEPPLTSTSTIALSSEAA
jgi:hypothetical protein